MEAGNPSLPPVPRSVFRAIAAPLQAGDPLAGGGYVIDSLARRAVWEGGCGRVGWLLSVLAGPRDQAPTTGLRAWGANVTEACEQDFGHGRPRSTMAGLRVGHGGGVLPERWGWTRGHGRDAPHGGRAPSRLMAPPRRRDGTGPDNPCPSPGRNSVTVSSRWRCVRVPVLMPK
jgi:hypothetical protein